MLISALSFGQRIYPPWCSGPMGGEKFDVKPIDNVPDLHGDINNPQLVVFFAGNQFMVVPDLIKAFKEEYPRYKRIFVETLPPGILAKQIEKGGLILGNLKITLKPDIFTAGKGRMKKLAAKSWFAQTAPYARNRLAIMVYKGNPKNVHSLSDLAKPDIRISMPNPKWEGIALNIEKAYVKAGGQKLRDEIMVAKVKKGTTFLTHIHHRQTPMRIMKKKSDAGPVWYTEAYFQKMIGNPIGMVKIQPKNNVVVTYVAGRMKSAPHMQAAKDFFSFLQSAKAQAIYQKYGFLPVHNRKMK